MTGLGALSNGADLLDPGDGLVVWPDALLAAWRTLRQQVVMFTPSSAVSYYWQLDGSVSTGNATGTFYLNPDDYVPSGYSVEYRLQMRQVSSGGATPATGLFQAGSMGGGSGNIIPNLGGATVSTTNATGTWNFGPVPALLQMVSQVSAPHSGVVWANMVLFYRCV